MTNTSFELAPDGGRVLMSTLGPDFRADVVVRDLATGSDTRVPAPRPTGAMMGGTLASWAPGGRLFFGVGGIEASEIYDWPADGSTGGRKLQAGWRAQIVAGGRAMYFTRDERGGAKWLGVRDDFSNLAHSKLRMSRKHNTRRTNRSSVIANGQARVVGSPLGASHSGCQKTNDRPLMSRMPN